MKKYLIVLYAIVSSLALPTLAYAQTYPDNRVTPVVETLNGTLGYVFAWTDQAALDNCNNVGDDTAIVIFGGSGAVLTTGCDNFGGQVYASSTLSSDLPYHWYYTNKDGQVASWANEAAFLASTTALKIESGTLNFPPPLFSAPDYQYLAASVIPFSTGSSTTFFVMVLALVGILIGALIIGAITRAITGGVKQLPFVQNKGGSFRKTRKLYNSRGKPMGWRFK